MTFNLARAGGPALGAVSVAQLGIPASFLLNAVSYLALATSPRTRTRRRGCSSRWRSASADGSWRSGRSPSSTCGPSASLVDGAIAAATGVRPAGIVLALPALAAAALVWHSSRRYG